MTSPTQFGQKRGGEQRQSATQSVTETDDRGGEGESVRKRALNPPLSSGTAVDPLMQPTAGRGTQTRPCVAEHEAQPLHSELVGKRGHVDLCGTQTSDHVEPRGVRD